MLNHVRSRQILATAAVAIVASIGSVAGVSLAQGNESPRTVSTALPAAARSGSVLADIGRELADLVAAGTIDQRQADAVQQQANAGTIDVKQLVDSGTLTDAQMRAVADRIDQVKRSHDG